MGKKLLYLQDLYNYYFAMNKNCKFSSNDGESIVVHVAGNMKFDNNSEEGLTPVTLQSCHIGRNLNKSNIDESVMIAALPSFANKPILGYIHEVNGQYEFYGHNMHIDDDGEVVYDEIPVGIIPESCEAKLEYDKAEDKTYCIVNGYLFDEYSKASEILKREKECSVSVELCIKELAYDAKEKILDIKDFYFSGVTILGKDEDGEKVMPGMAGSNIKLADFSQERNSVLFDETMNGKLVETLDKLNETLSKFNIDSTRKDVNQMDENLETFEETVVEEQVEEVEETIVETIEESTEEMSEEAIDETTETDETEEATEEIDEAPEVEEDEVKEVEEDKFSVKKLINSEERKLSFELSFDEITYALYNLIAQFDELDNDMYFIHSVYEDHFVMQGLWAGSLYGCKYVKDGNDVSLDGERWSLHQELLTDSELASLKEMRSNYSTIEEKLKSYEKAELDKQKEAVFEDEAYSEYLDAEEFKTLINNKEDYSVEELKEKAEIAFAKCVKKKGVFSIKKAENKSVKHGLFSTKESGKKNPYGSLFD